MFSESKDSKYAYLYNEHYSSFTAENFRSSSSDDYSFKFDGANKPITNNKYDRTICLKKNMNLNQISQDPLNAYWLCESRWADDQTLKSLNQVVAGKHEEPSIHNFINSRFIFSFLHVASYYFKHFAFVWNSDLKCFEYNLWNIYDSINLKNAIVLTIL